MFKHRNVLNNLKMLEFVFFNLCLFICLFLQYLILLLCIFLLEIIAGVLAYVNYQEVKCFSFGLYNDNPI